MSTLRSLLSSRVSGLIVIPGTAAPPPNNPPAWDSQPSAVYDQGVRAAVDFNAITSDIDADKIVFSLNTGAVSLPTGVVWTAAVQADTTNYLDGGDIAAFDFGAAQDFTVEFRIKHQKSSNTARVVVGKRNGAAGGWQATLNESTADVAFTVDDGVSEVTATLTDACPDDDAWHHIAFTVDRTGDQIRAYVDGAEDTGSGSPFTIAAVTGALDAGTAAFRTHADNSAGTHWDNGEIDELRIWDDVRSAAEVLANRDVELAGTDANLIGYWKMNGAALGAVTTVIDDSPNSNTLTDTGGGGCLYSATGLLVYDGVGVADLTTGHVATIDDTKDTTISSSFSIDVAEGFVNSRNMNLFLQNGAGNELFDPAFPQYLLARTFNASIFQGRDFWVSSQRPTMLADWNAVNAANPLHLGCNHNAPLHNVPGFRVSANNRFGPITKWATQGSNVARGAVRLSGDGTDNNLLQGNKQTNTTNKNKQAGWTILVTNAATKQFMADITTDELTGSDRTGYGMGPGDVSNFIINFHDGTDVLTPTPAGQLRGVRTTNGAGSVDSILSSNSKQPIEIRLGSDLALPVTGTLPASNSYGGADATIYGATDEIDMIWLYNPATSQNFIGFHIIGYLPAAAGKCDLFLKSLSSLAHATQLSVTSAFNYVANSQNKSVTMGDWDADGTNEDQQTVGSFNFMTGFTAYWDLANTQVLAETGHITMRAWNCISGSHVLKRTRGLVHPHAMTATCDIPLGESIEGAAGFSPDNKGGPHQYDTSGTQVERFMRAMHFGDTFVRANPGGWATDKPRGQVVEVEHWGNHIDDVTPLDASHARWFWGLSRCAPAPVIFAITGQDSSRYALMIEEMCVDLDTDRVATVTPLGTYNITGGGTGTDGHPMDSWVWSTGGPGDFTDNGRRMYYRKLSDHWAVLINALDAFPGYNLYNPSHLPGGMSPRDPEDMLTPTDFAQLVTDGLLPVGYTLTEFNPATYVNTRMTNKLISLAPAQWSGLQYGPRQDLPDDLNNGVSPWTLSTVPWMARDNARNGGAMLNPATGVPIDTTFNLGPLEAVLLATT